MKKFEKGFLNRELNKLIFNVIKFLLWIVRDKQKRLFILAPYCAEWTITITTQPVTIFLSLEYLSISNYQIQKRNLPTCILSNVIQQFISWKIELKLNCKVNWNAKFQIVKLEKESVENKTGFCLTIQWKIIIIKRNNYFFK